MHPELFELKALVAGRLDAHRRREIDDHLGSCADCSRHYVALMLGSSSPKTAEAEARSGLVSSGAGASITIGGATAGAPVYGIDAPIAPAAPKPPAPRAPHESAPALDIEFPSSSRTQVPVSASLVDAIAKLRAEAEQPKVSPVEPVAAVTPIVAAIVEPPAPLIEPSIFTPTPPDGVSIVRPTATPSASATAPERPSFMARMASVSPSRTVEAQPELVVTFSSTPSRITSYRSPTNVAAVTPSSDREYVSQAVPNSASQPLSDFSIAETTVGRKPKSAMMGVMVGGAVLVAVLAFGGYKYFQSSVAQAATAAAAAAAKQVEAAAAARTAAAPAPVSVAPAAPQVQTRIVYVDRPAKRSDGKAQPTDAAPSAAAPQVPVAVTLPDVNVSTGASENALQVNSQRSATSELGRSARATATRTAAPRPF